MNLTPEQSQIIDHIKDHPEDDLILIKAVAGSGKTTLLTAIAEAIPHTSGLYLAYNKSIATSSSKKFPLTTHCLTTHSMAYRAIVPDLKLKVGTFTYRNIKESITYEEKCLLVDLIREFCLSKYTDYKQFSSVHKMTKLDKYAIKYMNLMQQGKLDCTHEFYLKLFHIYLYQEKLDYDEFDFLMLDEAGDLNEVTLEIFKLLPAKLKIAVGDPHQNIYSFNHTINCFEILEKEGKSFPLSKSFRVPDNIAANIQYFCHNYLDPDMDFIGIPPSNSPVVSRAYITRTNSALIGKMVELNNQRTPYGLVRKASEIFRLPLMLANIKYQHYISDPHYKFLQADYDTWYEDPQLKKDFPSVYGYFMSLYPEDLQLTQGCKLLFKHGKKTIFDTYYEAKSHENTKQNLTLTTAHSAKGLEFDEVTIGNDLNDVVSEVLNNLKEYQPPERFILMSQPMRDELNLYYVACSRATKNLYNAICLKK